MIASFLFVPSLFPVAADTVKPPADPMEAEASAHFVAVTRLDPGREADAQRQADRTWKALLAKYRGALAGKDRANVPFDAEFAHHGLPQGQRVTCWNRDRERGGQG